MPNIRKRAKKFIKSSAKHYIAENDEWQDGELEEVFKRIVTYVPNQEIQQTLTESYDYYEEIFLSCFKDFERNELCSSKDVVTDATAEEDEERSDFDVQRDDDDDGNEDEDLLEKYSGGPDKENDREREISAEEDEVMDLEQFKIKKSPKENFLINLQISTGRRCGLKSLVNLMLTFLREMGKRSRKIDHTSLSGKDRVLKHAEEIWEVVTVCHFRHQHLELGHTFLPTYEDAMAALMAEYVEHIVIHARHGDGKKSIGRSLCARVCYVVHPSSYLDILLQLEKLEQEDHKVILPLIRHCIRETKPENSHEEYLKYMLTVYKMRTIFHDKLDKIYQTALSVAAPKNFMIWLADTSSSVVESMPTDKKFKKRHVTRFLLNDLTETLYEELLELLTDLSSEIQSPADQQNEEKSTGNNVISGKEASYVMVSDNEPPCKKVKMNDKGNAKKKQKSVKKHDKKQSDDIFVTDGNMNPFSNEEPSSSHEKGIQKGEEENMEVFFIDTGKIAKNGLSPSKVKTLNRQSATKEKRKSLSRTETRHSSVTEDSELFFLDKGSGSDRKRNLPDSIEISDSSLDEDDGDDEIKRKRKVDDLEEEMESRNAIDVSSDEEEGHKIGQNIGREDNMDVNHRPGDNLYSNNKARGTDRSDNTVIVVNSNSDSENERNCHQLMPDINKYQKLSDDDSSSNEIDSDQCSSLYEGQGKKAEGKTETRDVLKWVEDGVNGGLDEEEKNTHTQERESLKNDRVVRNSKRSVNSQESSSESMVVNSTLSPSKRRGTRTSKFTSKKSGSFLDEKKVASGVNEEDKTSKPEESTRNTRTSHRSVQKNMNETKSKRISDRTEEVCDKEVKTPSKRLASELKRLEVEDPTYHINEPVLNVGGYGLRKKDDDVLSTRRRTVSQSSNIFNPSLTNKTPRKKSTGNVSDDNDDDSIKVKGQEDKNVCPSVGKKSPSKRVSQSGLLKNVDSVTSKQKSGKRKSTRLASLMQKEIDCRINFK